MHISKPSQASDNDEDEFDDSEEEPHACKSLDNNIDDDEEEDCKNEEPEMQFGVTPFISGVLPAGRLRARTKPVGCQASGLIQVRLKTYHLSLKLLRWIESGWNQMTESFNNLWDKIICT